MTAPLKIPRLIFAATTVCPLDGAERSNKGSFDWIRMIDTLAKATLYTNKVTCIYTRKVTRIYMRIYPKNHLKY